VPEYRCARIACRTNQTQVGPNDGVPHIIGTGFVVDVRGIVMTAGHVARVLSSLPKHPLTGKHAAVAILFSEPTRVRDGLEMKPLWIEVKGYSFLQTFTTNEGIFYGEKIPDLAFVQLEVRDITSLTFCAAPNAIRIGLDVAFAGFPFGSDGLLHRIEDQPPIVVQATPFLRHGVVSSHSSQGQTADRVLMHVETECASEKLVNQRWRTWRYPAGSTTHGSTRTTRSSSRVCSIVMDRTHRHST